MRSRDAVVRALVLSVALAGAAVGGEKEFVDLGLGGGGGIFQAVSIPHDPELMFCSSDMSGVYRSTDGGRYWRMLPWRQLSGAITWPIVFHPTDPNVLYCIPGGWARPAIKVSRDKGLTWKPLTDRLPWAENVPHVTSLGIDPTGEVLLVSAAEGLFRSEDEGKSWSRTEGIDKRAIGFVFERPGRGRFWYAATAEGVFRSGDLARTWKPCPAGPPGERIVAFCGGADDEAGQVALYCSVPTKEAEGKLAGGIYRSADRGKTWQRAMGKGINTTVGRKGRSRRSVPEYAFLGMAVNQTRTVYAYCYGNGDRPPHHDTVYRTDDGGETWRAVWFDRSGFEGFNVSLSWIRLDRGHGDRRLNFLVNARDSNYVAFTDMMCLYQTRDGGKTWRQSHSECAEGAPGPGKRWRGIGLEMTTTWHFKFDPHDPKRVYICYTDIGFARSLDRGKTWYWAARGSPWSNTFYDIAFDPKKPGVIYAACAYEHDIPAWKMSERVYGGGGVCISTDWGATWKPISKGLPAVGACTGVDLDPDSPADRRTLYCTIYGGGVFKSTDGGATWVAKNNGLRTDANDHFTDIRLHADGTLLALCGGKKLGRYQPVEVNGLYRSTDGGASWTDLTKDVKMYLPYGFDVHPTDSRIIYLCVSAVPRKHDEAGVYKTVDGGATWTKLKIDWPAGGPSWQHPKWPNIDPYRPDRVWVSTGTHGTMITTDAGKTWKPFEGIPFLGVSRVAVDPADHQTIWATTFGGGIWRGPAEGTE